MVRAPERTLSEPPPATTARPAEQSRARYPDETGFIQRNGIRVFYEAYGSGEPTIMLLPSWSIVHSRIWKMQVPDLARRFTVVTFDPRGNGRSSRPTSANGYAETEFAADALAVMDATGTERAVVVSLSRGARPGLLLASDHPKRIAGAVFIAPALALGRSVPGRGGQVGFLERPESDVGWAKYNADYWRREYGGFLEFFFSQCFSEPHSTKAVEDAVAWGLETDSESLILSDLTPGIGNREAILERCARIRCPVLVIHGRDDGVRPHGDGEELAHATGGRLVTIEGGGHIPNVRDPVKVNLAIRDFATRLRYHR
ncbi:MAG: alpha/beta fold hydrolase [Chloroflexota bacterium]